VQFVAPISLIGLPGSGKSTVADSLAKAMGRKPLHLDAEVEHAAGQSIGALFAHQGEPAFRELERETLLRALASPGVVIATGGGTPLHHNGMRELLHRSTVIYLHLSVEVAAQRVYIEQSSHRFLFAGLPKSDTTALMRGLFAERHEVYSQAHLLVNADGTPDEVVDRILEVLNVS